MTIQNYCMNLTRRIFPWPLLNILMVTLILSIKLLSFVMLRLKTQLTPERKNIANFNDNHNTNLFIIGKCETGHTVNDNNLFCIFKHSVLIKTLNKIIIANQKLESSGSKVNQSMAKFHSS